MLKEHFDIIVLGSGPAGEAAAMNAKKNGRNVAVVCDLEYVGGSCTHLGTIPSKSLRHSVKQVMQFNSNPMFRDLGDARKLSFQQVLKHAERVIYEQVSMRTDFYDRNHIPIFKGRASFLNKHTIKLVGKRRKLSAEYFVIATGSSPYHPPGVDFTHPCVFDSDSILDLDHSPRKVTVIGAGVIGCEYASIFGGLGCKVELINPASGLLTFLDTEIADALSYHLRNLGVRSRHNEEFEKMEYHDDHIVTYLQSGKKIRSDIVLWANGRSGNTANLGLKQIGLETNTRQQISVDDSYRTSVKNVYAAGDVIGWPSLAGAAYDQGRAASNAIVAPDDCYYVEQVATGIYTIPEISTLGATEQELTEQKIPYEVGKAFFKNTARAQITGEQVGMLKLIFHFETLELLGIHCFGDQASEIVHIGQAIMRQPPPANSMKYFLTTTFNYPTMAEAYRTAALDGLNRVF
ncbi:Si-specific NAD(P)(+) transhydrogenase [Gammaproteobacteria bacterium]|nr:Si-specific NAD(P)(+) transhydrogenase [Gammaproteobacteria bacterium]MDC3197007.1 Si-specific NAD(P)(+) transhydrogenase [Gammaproteobacteria bacterium]MDC3267538.1 Si-specific NAD(P)(+) transhydrogenase [bacterium]